MPKIEIKEFEQFKQHGYKGVFFDGCIEYGKSHEFRKRVHAHNETQDPNFGWICIGKKRPVFTPDGRPSLLLIHELAHILLPDNKTHDDLFEKKREQLWRKFDRMKEREVVQYLQRKKEKKKNEQSA